jgi:RHS repeat-associated protein
VYEHIEYTPYGELWVEQGIVTGKTPFRFTGKELDKETGLYYYGARYLNPQTSMWLSADPAMGEYIPQAPINDEAKKYNQNLPGMGGVYNYVNLHTYHYAGNNPVKLVDPDGRFIDEQKDTTRVKYRKRSIEMKDIKWGSLGNIADNGCGVIAAYNVLYSKNPYTSFIKVRDELKKMGAYVLFGKLGVLPEALTSLMKSNYNDVYSNFDLSGIDLLNGSNAEKTGKAGAVIVLVAWDEPLKNGMHYFTGIHKEGTDEFYFYNSGITGVNKHTPITMEQLAEKINAMKATPTGLITIKD